MNEPDLRIAPQMKRVRQRTGSLAIISVVLIILMVTFEFGAVLFLRARLGMDWEREFIRQVAIQRLDILRTLIREVKPSNELNRAEKEWVMRELDYAAGTIIEYDKQLSADDYQKIIKNANILNEHYEKYWKNGKFIINPITIDYQNADKALNEEIKGVLQ